MPGIVGPHRYHDIIICWVTALAQQPGPGGNRWATALYRSWGVANMLLRDLQ